MKKFLLANLVSIAAASKIFACSVTPIDVDAAVKAIEKYALIHYGYENEDSVGLFGVKTTDAKAEYIWTPMCPEGFFAEAIFTLTRLAPADGFCRTKIKVKKSVIYNDTTTIELKEISDECR